MDNEKPVLARAIIEMLGGPADYIFKTLKDYIITQKEGGLKVIKEEYHEPIQQEKLFSAFVELDLSFKDVNAVLSFCFECMPSSIEIYEPEKLFVPLQQFNGFLNDLQARLHDADMIVKTVRAQNTMLDNNAVAILQNFIVSLLKDKPRTIEEISTIVGIKLIQLRPFIDKLVEQNKLDVEDDVLKIPA